MPHPSVILLAAVGSILLLGMLLKRGLVKIGLPPLVGYISIGLLVNLLDTDLQLMEGSVRHGIEFLAEAGVVVLLFRVGLEANLDELVAQIRGASAIWLANVALSFALGYGVASGLLGYGLVPSLLVGTALSATSLGVPLAIWRDAGALHSKVGSMLIDVAELDDISGVVLMALLLALVPTLLVNNGVGIDTVLPVGLLLLAKFAGFIAFCFLFTRFLEAPLMRSVMAHSPSPGPVIVVAGFGFVIAALAGFLGFSTAIGAFFAGLAFSRDPAESKIDRDFQILYDLFAPFFFVGLGLLIDIDALVAGLGIGAVLLIPAVIGKLAGGGLPAWMLIDARAGWLLGVSLIPRAEIAMIVMLQGMRYGPDVIPAELFNGMVAVTFATSLAIPIVLQRMLRRDMKTRA